MLDTWSHKITWVITMKIDELNKGVRIYIEKIIVGHLGMQGGKNKRE